MQTTPPHTLLSPHRLFGLSLACFAISLPFFKSWQNVGLGLVVLAGLVLAFRIRKGQRPSGVQTAFMGLYLVMAVSYFYSDDKSYALKVLTRTAIFLALPLVFAWNRDVISRRFIVRALRFFVLACLVSSFVCIASATAHTVEYAAVNPFNESNGNFFSYFKLTSVFDFHPVYLGIYVLLSIVLLLDGEKMEWPQRFSRRWRIAAICWLVVFSVLLNSFLVVIVETLLFIAFAFYSSKTVWKRLRWNALAWLCVLACGIYASSYFLSEKFKGIHIVEDVTTRDYSGTHFTAIKARNAKAYCSIQLIEDHPLFGVGIGDGNEMLLQYFLKYRFQHGYDMQFNSHNQYLTTYIGAELAGFLCLLAIPFLLFRAALRRKSFILFSFATMSTLFFLTESALERQAGIYFYCFFALLLSEMERPNLRHPSTPHL